MTARQKRGLNWSMVAVLITAGLVFTGFVDKQASYAKQEDVDENTEDIIRVKSSTAYLENSIEKIDIHFKELSVAIDTLLARSYR